MAHEMENGSQYMPIPETYNRRKLNTLYREIPLKDTVSRMLRKYFNAMANQLAHIDDEAVQLSYELLGIIKDSTDLSQRITGENFVL